MTTIFTRYLYIKEEVHHALLIALLRNKKDEALFWGFELFHSGFAEELMDHLWTIYYDFYATLNPLFEKYFIRKHSDALVGEIGMETMIASIITNLCSKFYTTDVYALRIQFDAGPRHDHDHNEDRDHEEHHFESLFAAKDYKRIGACILGEPTTQMVCIRDACLAHYKLSSYRAMLLPPKIDVRHRFLAHIMQICSLQVFVLPENNGKNMSDAHTTYSSNDSLINATKPNRRLEIACKYKINASGLMSLFRLQRHEDGVDVKKQYKENWLYYSAQTPYWTQKIQDHCGAKNDELMKVVFPSVEQEEAFNNAHWLDPDEQSSETQDACVGDIALVENGIAVFCEKFGALNIVDA